MQQEGVRGKEGNSGENSIAKAVQGCEERRLIIGVISIEI